MGGLAPLVNSGCLRVTGSGREGRFGGERFVGMIGQMPCDLST